MDNPVQPQPILPVGEPQKGKKRWLIVGAATVLAAMEAAIAVGLLPRAVAVVRPLVEAAQELLAE